MCEDKGGMEAQRPWIHFSFQTVQSRGDEMVRYSAYLQGAKSNY